MRSMPWCALLLTAIFFTPVRAADVPLEFEDPARQERYTDLLKELRCLVCQNQSLADSHADLAQDLRREVYQMVEQGQDNQAIVDFLVARYGDFVLYRPPLQRSTWLLWLGPFLLLGIGMLAIYLFIRSRKPEDKALSPHERERLSRLLRETDGD